MIIGWIETGLTAAEMLGDRCAVGVHLGNLGNRYSDLGEPRKAIEYHKQALAISREIGDKEMKESAWATLARPTLA